MYSVSFDFRNWDPDRSDLTEVDIVTIRRLATWDQGAPEEEVHSVAQSCRESLPNHDQFSDTDEASNLFCAFTSNGFAERFSGVLAISRKHVEVRGFALAPHEESAFVANDDCSCGVADAGCHRGRVPRPIGWCDAEQIIYVRCLSFGTGILR